MITNSVPCPCFVALLARAGRMLVTRFARSSFRVARSPQLSVALVAGLAAVATAGCSHLDTTPAGSPERVLTGAVNFNATVPAGAEIVVRVIEVPGIEPARTAANDVPLAARPTLQRAERVLGEFRQVVNAATMQPVPFQLEYHAEDAVLRRGLNVDVRVSVGGKVRLRTINAHVLTLASAPFKQEIWVQPVQ